MQSPVPLLHRHGAKPSSNSSSRCALALMGHAILERQPGAAQITLARYTHALPEVIEHARATLSAYLAERQASEASAQ